MMNLKFVFTVSLVAIMAVTAANAEIASTTYYTGDADVVKIAADSEKTNAINVTLDTAEQKAVISAKQATSSQKGVVQLENTYTETNKSDASKAATNAAITAALGTLDVNDTAQSGKYVSSVSEVDGKITVTRESLPTVDTALNSTSTNAVQNKAVNAALGGKVAIAQGDTNTNKVMITNASGTITPVVVTTDGTGGLVTGVSVSDGKFTVTKGASLPTVNNATLTIQKNGVTVDTFTANASGNKTVNITVPTKVSELSDDVNYVKGKSVGDTSRPVYVASNGQATVVDGTSIPVGAMTGSTTWANIWIEE